MVGRNPPLVSDLPFKADILAEGGAIMVVLLAVRNSRSSSNSSISAWADFEWVVEEEAPPTRWDIVTGSALAFFRSRLVGVEEGEVEGDEDFRRGLTDFCGGRKLLAPHFHRLSMFLSDSRSIPKTYIVKTPSTTHQPRQDSTALLKCKIKAVQVRLNFTVHSLIHRRGPA